MYEDYMYEYGSELGEAFMVSAGNMLTSSIISILTYVLLALGMYTIAKRRGIKNPWLAWLPIGSSWILGSISDHYRYAVKREIKSKRKVLVILEIIMYVLVIAVVSCAVLVVVNAFRYEMGEIGSYAFEQAMMGPGVVMILGLLPMIGIAIALVILQYMALYDLYRSTVPENATLFLVLSILIGITQPFFVFCNRKKDDGMYPAPNPYAPQQPGYIPQQPVYQPQQPVYPQQPAYQPQQPVIQETQPEITETNPEPMQEVEPWDRPEGE